MILSLSLALIMSLIAGSICEKIKLPKNVGMILTGILLGPFVLNLFDEKLLSISGELRKIALIVILLKAGLALDLKDLIKVGRPAILLSFLPATFEIIGYSIFAKFIFDIPLVEAALMGTVLSAVSPAVVVPRMVNLIENKIGTEKAIPQMILAGASMDDIFVIVLFSTFLGLAQNNSFNYMELLKIPVSIIMGIVVGVIFGIVLCNIFEYKFKNSNYIRNTTKVIIILATSFFLVSLEDIVKDYIAISGLLAVLSMAITIRIKSPDIVVGRLSEKFGKIWIGAELILFVLVGAAVDIRFTFNSGIGVVIVIAIALVFRTLGVILSTANTGLTLQERIFCTYSYLPKATVQAAIGTVPLSMGINSGDIILSVAVVGILLTAPIGAFLIDRTAMKVLEQS
ncbi:cation:proton antiporter [Mediannikoviicoccus vaginalis]|uniref:cation:proton antiporter n=1 Tax=Mediannikoviicoccus vaginalis TaxID=2899727 RepID=UPI001F005FA5|nr:cation:proton antiporter [Mediannikoviicoccus vaginalis]